MKEALKLALEALTNAIAVRNGEGGTKLVSPLEENAITAIKEALAQPDYRAVKTYHEGKPVYVSQPEQEPVAWGVFEGNLHDMFFIKAEAVEMAHLKGSHAEVRPLYTTPPQRPWVSLTDAAMFELSEFRNAHGYVPTSAKRLFARIEAKLKELNT